MMVARVFGSESSTDMALLLKLGRPANTGEDTREKGRFPQAQSNSSPALLEGQGEPDGS